MAVLVQITTAGDGRTVTGVPVRAGQTIVVDARTAAGLVRSGAGLYQSATEDAA